MRDAIFVHGFNIHDNGASTIHKLIPEFSPFFNCLKFDYGWTGLLGVRLANGTRSRILSSIIEDGTIGIGHSNGCTILHRASKLNTKLKHLILINPALDADTKFAPHLKTVSVYYTPKDEATRWAKYLLFHRWGDMGNKGSTIMDSRVTNYNEFDLFGVTTHSGIFHDTYARKEIVNTFIRTLIKNLT